MPAKFKITLSNDTVDAFCAQDGYRATVPDPATPGGSLPNPETKEAFIERRVAEYIKGTALAAADTAFEASQKAAKEANRNNKVSVATEKV